jgi:DNA-directed RNA polymerase delta subunit
MERDERGRFVSKTIAQRREEVEKKEAEVVALNTEIEELMAEEREPPEWLRDLVVHIADYLGISSREFTERVKVYHPKNIDPVLLVDGKPIVSWV